MRSRTGNGGKRPIVLMDLSSLQDKYTERREKNSEIKTREENKPTSEKKDQSIFFDKCSMKQKNIFDNCFTCSRK